MDALHGAVDPGRAGLQPGQGFTAIARPPLPPRQAILKGRSGATFRAMDGGISAMHQPEIEGLFLGVEVEAFDPPGVG